MNHAALLLIVIVGSLFSVRTHVVADEDETPLSAEQVVDLLLSADSTDHQRGVDYVVDHKPDLTTQISTLMDGLASNDHLVASGCYFGLWHGQWDLHAMERHIPRLFELLTDGNRHARMAARNTLVRIAPSLKNRVPELLGLAKEHPLAMDSIIAISKEIGLSNRELTSAWLPLAVNYKRCRNEICSLRRSSKILLELAEDAESDSVVSTILEMLASYRQKPKGAGEFATRMLTHPSSEVRAAAIASLDEIPHDWCSSRADLLRIARTDEEELRAAATRRLFSDPSLGKEREELHVEEQQVAEVIDRAFSADSSRVRRAACLAARFTFADRIWIASHLLERLTDSDEEVQMAAQVALMTRVGFALYTVNHDLGKLELYLGDQNREQFDRPADAQARLDQTMSEIRQATAKEHAFLKFIESAATHHDQETVRDFLKPLLTDDAREDVRESIPERFRIEASTSSSQGVDGVVA